MDTVYSFQEPTQCAAKLAILKSRQYCMYAALSYGCVLYAMQRTTHLRWHSMHTTHSPFTDNVLDLVPTTNGYVLNTTLDASLVLEYLVEAKGNLALATERLGKAHDTVYTQGQIINAIKDNLADLKSYMEVIATLELFGLMPILHKTFIENLTALEPQDAVNAYLGLMKLIGASTTPDKSLVNININELLWKHVPRDLQALLIEDEQGTNAATA